MSEMHPIFTGIFEGIAPGITKKENSAPCLSSAKDLIDDVIVDDCPKDCYFYTLQQLEDLEDAVRNHPEGLIEIIRGAKDSLANECLENNICPECGGSMEWEHDSRFDTYVPYGSTSVLESEGGAMKCANCGFTKED